MEIGIICMLVTMCPVFFLTVFIWLENRKLNEKLYPVFPTLFSITWIVKEM